MSILVPKWKFYRLNQPRGYVEVDHNHPLARSLELAVIGPTRDKPDSVRQIPVSSTTGTFFDTANEYGYALGFGSESVKSVWYNAPLFGRPFTCIVGYHLRSIPTSSRTVCGNFVNNASGFRFVPTETNFKAQFGRSGAAQLLTGSAIATGNKIDAIVADLSTFKYYENGALSVSAAQAGWVDPTELFSIGGSVSQTTSPIMSVAFVYYFSRALEPDEIKELTEAPYQILKPGRQLFKVSAVHETTGDLVGPGAVIDGAVTRDSPFFSVTGDLVGPGAIMAGVVHHAAVLNHDLTGDLVGNSPVVTGQMKVGIIHDLTADLVAGSPYITGRFNNDTQGPPQQVVYIVGGDGEPVKKRKRITSANEDLDKLFNDVIKELFGLNDVGELEDVIDSLPITFYVDIEAMTRIEEIKTMIAAYEQWLDDEAAAEILLMG